MGRRLSGTHPGGIADFGNPEAGRNPFPQDAGTWPRPPVGRDADLVEGDQLNGDTAFKLYDTYGFPLDLTQDALRARGIARRYRRFSNRRHGSGRRRRRARPGRVPATRRRKPSGMSCKDKLGATEFLGYDTEIAEGVVQAIVRDGKAAGQAHPRARTVQLVSEPDAVLRRIRRPDGRYRRHCDGDHAKLTVTDVQKARRGSVRALRIRRTTATVTLGDAAALTVDHARRSRLRANHSATHLLHEALARGARHPCGPEGLAGRARAAALRYVASRSPCRLRRSKIVEDMANEIIVQNSPVTTRLMSVDDAIAEGAMALFGEKYGDEVRVVSMGQGIHGRPRTTGPIRSNCAAAPMSAQPARSALCALSAKVPLVPVSAVWKR